MWNKYFRSTPFAIFLCGIAVILYITGTAVEISTIKTDISLVKSQNRIMQNDIDLLRVEQERLSSRLKYTVTVVEAEVMLDKLIEVQKVTDTMAMRYRTLDEILIQMFGRNK